MPLAEVVGLFFYFTQQLGMALGVGAQTAGLFLQSNADAERKIQKVISLGFWLIVLSGLCITLAHVVAGDSNTILEPVYVFKWILIVLLIALAWFARIRTMQRILAGAAGATWYALFVLHTLAPAASWTELFFSYAFWLILFTASFVLLLNLKRKKTAALSEPAPISPSIRVEQFRAPALQPVPKISVAPVPASFQKPISSPVKMEPQIKPWPEAPKAQSHPILQKVQPIPPTVPKAPSVPASTPPPAVKPPAPIQTQVKSAPQILPAQNPIKSLAPSSTLVSIPVPATPKIVEPKISAGSSPAFSPAPAVPKMPIGPVVPPVPVALAPKVFTGRVPPAVPPGPINPIPSKNQSGILSRLLKPLQLARPAANPPVEETPKPPQPLPKTPVSPAPAKILTPSVVEIPKPLVAPSATGTVQPRLEPEPYQYKGLSHVTVMPKSKKELEQ